MNKIINIFKRPSGKTGWKIDGENKRRILKNLDT